jgi:hypothetical protein
MGEDILQIHIELKEKYPYRFQVYGGVNWEMWKILGDAFPEWASNRLGSNQGWVYKD